MIFISYSREDEAKVRQIAEALRFRTDYDLWQDVRIRAGQVFNLEIDRALSKAKAVIVFWSKRSVESSNVIAEANYGRDAGKLIPVKIEDCTAPYPFGTSQTIDLTKFEATPPFGDAGLSQLISEVGRYEKLPRDVLSVVLSAGETDQFELMRRITGGVEVLVGMNPREAVGGEPFVTGLALVGFTVHRALEFGEYSGANVLPLLADIKRAHLVILTFFPTLLVYPGFYKFLIDRCGDKPVFLLIFGAVDDDELLEKYPFVKSVPEDNVIRRNGVGFPLGGEAAKETWKFLRRFLRALVEKQTKDSQNPTP